MSGFPFLRKRRWCRLCLNRGWGVAAGERFRFNAPPAIRITTSTLLPTESVKLAGDIARIVRGGLRTAGA